MGKPSVPWVGGAGRPEAPVKIHNTGSRNRPLHMSWGLGKRDRGLGLLGI